MVLLATSCFGAEFDPIKENKSVNKRMKIKLTLFWYLKWLREL